MEPLQELLETVRAIRETQLQAREIQLRAVETQLRAVRHLRLFAIIVVGVGVTVAYMLWRWFVLTHQK